MQNPLSLADIVEQFDLTRLLMLRYKLGELKCTYKTLPETVPRPVSDMGADIVGKVVSEVHEYCIMAGFQNGRDKAYGMMLHLGHHRDLQLDSSWLSIELENLISELARDVFNNNFVHVAGELRRYVNQKDMLIKSTRSV